MHLFKCLIKTQKITHLGTCFLLLLCGDARTIHTILLGPVVVVEPGELSDALIDF